MHDLRQGIDLGIDLARRLSRHDVIEGRLRLLVLLLALQQMEFVVLLHVPNMLVGRADCGRLTFVTCLGYPSQGQAWSLPELKGGHSKT